MSRETAGVDKNIAAKVALLGLPVMLPLHVPLQVPGGVETKKCFFSQFRVILRQKSIFATKCWQ